MPSVDEQIRALTAGAVDVVSEAELRKKLERGTPLRAKLGLDPTKPDIHIGHSVVLHTLRRFQELGHTAVLIVGDFTAVVGDPSDRSSTRPALSKEEAEANAETYFDQAKKILLPDNLEIRHNSEWLGKMDIADVLRLTARVTVAQMLERDDFEKRYKDGKPISIMEFLYPLLQGWDSVMINADVELGGTDQLFNNLMGRTLQEQEGQEPQVVITVPLLEGLDGMQKMSKSLDNYVAVTEAPATQFGKLMSVPDTLTTRYFALTSGASADDVADFTMKVERGGLSPVEAKRAMARRVVDAFHGDGAGESAEAEFDRVFKSKETPTDIPEHLLDDGEAVDGRIRLANVLRQAGLVKTNAEGKRQITQGGVKIDGQAVSDPDATYAPAELQGATLQVGRRRWVKIRVPGE
ncbi:MAG: tyrosine--tRNA ligase [Actinobacteria bacterium]|nr:tyrosine--tRNA ligase [Actinomycetota bacterium]